MVHRLNIFLLSILLVLSQIIIINRANATTVAGEGWTVQKRLVQGATTFYDGTKSVILNGKNYAATGTAAITPVAGQVAKMIVRTGAVIAVDLAVKALIGAVDYVMDPANSQVKYYVDAPDQDPKTAPKIYVYSAGTGACSGTKIFYSVSAATNDAQICFNKTGRTGYAVSTDILPNYLYVNFTKGTDKYNAVYEIKANPIYDPNAQKQREERTLSYDAVASQIISDALANKADGKAYVSTVADTALENEKDQIVPADQVIDQLNQTQAIPTSNTATGTATPSATTGTGTGDPTAQPAPSTDISLNFPVFCSWAPTVCQAAQTVVSFPSTLQKWWDTGSKAVSEAWTSTKEWMNADDTPADPTEVEIEDPKVDVPNTNYFNWGAYCPFTPGSQSISLGDTSASIDYDLSSWCELATNIRPFVLAAGALMSFLIAAGIVMGRDD